MKKYLFFIIIIIIYLISNIYILKGYYSDFGDIALISIQVEKAKQGKEYLGPYSRMGFHHPGPIIFYYYAFLDNLLNPFINLLNFKSISSKYFIYQFFLNIVFLIFIFIVLKEVIKEYSFLYIFLILYLILIENLNNNPFSILVDIWGPSIIIIPLLLLIFSLSIYLYNSEKHYLLFFIVISNTIIISNHLSGFIYAGLFSFLVILYLIILKKYKIDMNFILWFVISIIWLCIAIFPIVYEFIKFYPDNNILKILEISRQIQSIRKGKDVIIYFGEIISLFLTGKKFYFLGWITFIFIIIIIYKYNKKFKNKYIRILFILLNIETILFFIYVFKIPFDLLHYLSWFYFSIFLLYIFILLFIIYTKWNINLRYNKFSYYFIIFLIVVLIIRVYIKANNHQQGFLKEYNVLNQLNNHYRFDHSYLYKIEWGFNDEHHNNWVLGAGIVFYLYKNHISVCVEEKWLFMFGRDFQCNQPYFKLIKILKSDIYNDSYIFKKEKWNNYWVDTFYYYDYKIVMF